ncbi:hypothetical protein CROQUDRAFT_94680 [Cronartium quercuum f. sp. fusiforme G11]|uniref:Uncharacterized protein n=1 Tax=Cronartium quercuum f. sp. fusiforme G11 TaxID=708437 RepID=A0A9P6NDK2_9BASI|nr:hypothetical protein CROQUDRAFT_94680 [Cronartium quercuum f. sp. fusiforme G11]
MTRKSPINATWTGRALSKPDLDLCGSIKLTVAIPSSFSGTSHSHPHPSITFLLNLLQLL